ncbi:MAG: tandem-95 repeat protein, partial [Gammaproteobacteria bacterium]|nr:tandem-95 repeat protein [Gammaproteobacteria bacterium]
VSDPTAGVQVTVNGTTYAATNNGDGTWTLADNTIAPALADGTYDVSVSATDGVGNIGTDASIDELLVDATAPIVTVNSLTTLDRTPELTGTVNDPAATVRVTVGGTTYIAANNGDGTWTLADNTISSALAYGTHEVLVTATDPVGNVGVDVSTNELNIYSNPVAGDDAYTVDEDMAFTAALGVDDLLLNDGDADGDLLIVNTTPVSGPSNGTLLLNADGTFTYTPDAGFNGTDSFRYEISDGEGGFAQAIVMITVVPVNDAPIAVAESFTVDEDNQLSAVAGINDLLLNDSDRDGDALNVNATPVIGPSNGTLVLNADGTFTYNPDRDFNGTDAFTYQVSDGNGAVSEAIVTIAVTAVNDAPVGVTDSIEVTPGDSVSAAAASLLANDSDVDGDALNLVGFTQGIEGTVTQAADGSLVYTPRDGFSGADSFTYTVADASGAQDSVQVLVTVAPPDFVYTGDEPDNEPPPEEPSPEEPPPNTENDDSGRQGSGAGADTDNVDDGNSQPVTEPATADVVGALDEFVPAGGVSTDAAPVVRYEGPADDRSQQVKQRSDAPPPKFLNDVVETIERTFDVEIADFGMLKLNHLAVWETLDVMRRDMSDVDGAGPVNGVVMVQVTTGSSLLLSAGILTWILRGGALASALLSTLPVWQGFDPLPILMARKRSRDKAADEREDEKVLKESKADQFFEAAVIKHLSNIRGPASR